MDSDYLGWHGVHGADNDANDPILRIMFICNSDSISVVLFTVLLSDGLIKLTAWQINK